MEHSGKASSSVSYQSTFNWTIKLGYSWFKILLDLLLFGLLYQSAMAVCRCVYHGVADHPGHQGRGQNNDQFYSNLFQPGNCFMSPGSEHLTHHLKNFRHYVGTVVALRDPPPLKIIIGPNINSYVYLTKVYNKTSSIYVKSTTWFSPTTSNIRKHLKLAKACLHV